MTNLRQSRAGWAYTAALIWLGLTVSLASWWLLFSLDQARRLSAIGGEATRLSAVQRMLAWEGAVLLLLLLGGGVALVVGISRERSRRREVQDFFLAFTHDLRTALTSLRLQAESVAADLDLGDNDPTLARLLKDAVRLELQLENSLFFSQADVGLLPEPVHVQELVAEVAQDWPELSVEVASDRVVRADRRALRSVVRNVLQNAAVHGGARRIAVSIADAGSQVNVTLRDDGRGAQLPADLARRPFARVSATSGTGIGLFVSRRLIERMQGSLAFESMPGGGFAVHLHLPAAR